MFGKENIIMLVVVLIALALGIKAAHIIGYA
jgi:hypothetical protein